MGFTILVFAVCLTTVVLGGLTGRLFYRFGYEHGRRHGRLAMEDEAVRQGWGKHTPSGNFHWLNPHAAWRKKYNLPDD